jgi:hypothetical protein
MTQKYDFLCLPGFGVPYRQHMVYRNLFFGKFDLSEIWFPAAFSTFVDRNGQTDFCRYCDSQTD